MTKGGEPVAAVKNQLSVKILDIPRSVAFD
jgi:hypothetical protein